MFHLPGQSFEVIDETNVGNLDERKVNWGRRCGDSERALSFRLPPLLPPSAGGWHHRRMTDPTAGPPSQENDPVARAWHDVVATARRTAAEGLVVGTSGNVSVRCGDLVLVTPSGVPYDRLGPEDTVAVDLEGRQVLGELKPTSELPLHLAIHRGTGATAVVHTHAVHATAVSTLVTELPVIHYMAAALGGPVRVAPYALYGSDELAGNMLVALTDRTGCLLQNHGTVTYGTSLDQAYDRTAQAGVDVPALAHRVRTARPHPHPAVARRTLRREREAPRLRPAMTGRGRPATVGSGPVCSRPLAARPTEPDT